MSAKVDLCTVSVVVV